MVNITGIGTNVPAARLTNFDLEKMVETSDQWIYERTGIRERRIASGGISTSDMGSASALDALGRAGIAASDVDLIVVGTMTPDMLSPSTSCLIQKKIGADRAVCFDINAACSGFLYAMEVSRHFLRSAQYHTALVIGAEKISAFVDWKDRATCILFGDGSGAMVLSRSRPGHRIVGCFLGSDGGGSESLMIPAGGSSMPATVKTVEQRLHSLRMDGREIFKKAIEIMCKVSEDTVKRCGLNMSDIDLFVPHQANKRIIDAVAKKLGLPDERVFQNVESFGNTSAASIVLALDDAERQKRLKEGDRVLLVVFGAGFTWGGAVIEW